MTLSLLEDMTTMSTDECSGKSVEEPARGEREDLPTVEERGIRSNLSFTAYW